MIPQNFQRVKAPIMNAEMQVLLLDIAFEREKRIIKRQNLTGTLLTCLAQSLSSILKGDINTKRFVEQLSDAGKIAGDIFFMKIPRPEDVLPSQERAKIYKIS